MNGRKVSPMYRSPKPTHGGLMTAALFLAALNLRPAISSVSPLLALIRDDLGMSSAAASLLTSIPVLCMGLLSPVSAKLAGRVGTERVIRWSLVLIGFGTILRLFVHSAGVLLLTALIAGLGIAAMGPLLSGFIKQHFPSSVPAMIAVYSAGLSLGAALASSLSLPLQADSQSWQAALAVWSALGAAGAAVWRTLHRGSRSGPRKVSEVPSASLPWRNPKAWLLTLHFGLMAACFYSLLAWLPPVMQSLGYTSSEAAVMLTIFAITQIPAGTILQRLLRRYPSRLLWLWVSSVTQLAGLILLFSPLPWLAAAVIGLASGTLFALGLLLPMDAAATSHEAASWAAMTQSAGYLIGAAGPFLIGLIHDAAGPFSFAIYGLMGVTVALIVVQWFVAPFQAQNRASSKAAPPAKRVDLSE
ncbi:MULTISPECIES: MFS transporter [Paenibacillus]|nr:MFS transporter [Paenibacillus rhizosphaerae]